MCLYLVTTHCWCHLVTLGTCLQVVGGGDLDINFYIAGPPAVGVIVSTHRERQGSHNFKVEIAGRCDRK